MSVDWLTLVLVYAWQHYNDTENPAAPEYVGWCRRSAHLTSDRPEA